jgi:hypothetical protein
LPGAEEVLRLSGKRYFIFGELHGTAETPQLFGDFVCAAARLGPIVVALEMQADEQPRLDAFLSSDGSERPKAALLAGRHWTNRTDSRATGAMFALVERLRLMKASGLPLTVIASRPAAAVAQVGTAGERAMAEAWERGIAHEPRARLIALVGDAHAFRTKDPASSTEPAAMHLPREEVLNLIEARVGGSAWNCQDQCSVHEVRGAVPPVPPRGIMPVNPAAPESHDFDRWYSPGKAFTPSRPIAEEGSGAG